MFISKHSCAFAILSTFVVVVAGAAGCSPSPSSESSDVSGRGEIINQTKSALSSADITAITGIYTSCQSHADGDGWTVTGTDGVNWTGGDLKVVKDNTACQLTMTSITTTIAATATTYVAVPEILMTNTYAAASPFKIGGIGDTIFYGTAKISAAALMFAHDFQMLVVVSDAVGIGDAGAAPTPGWAVWSGSAAASTVPASNYTFDLTSAPFALTKTTDNTVDTVTGYAQLTAGSSLGEDYAIVTGSPTTFAEVDAAWKNATPALLSGLTTLELPASGFGLVGTSLTGGQARTVIVRHTDTASGVSSYQIFAITFTAS